MLTGLGLRNVARLVGRYGPIKGVALRARLIRTPWTATGTIVEIAVPGITAPIALRAGTSDALVLGDVFGAREFDFPVGNAKPTLIIDGGANIGLASICLANRFPDARIIAVEPNRGNYQLLQRNTRAYPNVTAIHAAIWEHSGLCRITNPDAEPWAFQVATAAPGDDAAISALSVSDLIRLSGSKTVDILKLDVEGAEVEILSRGVESWLANVNTFVIELHDQFKPGCLAALERAFRDQPFIRSRYREWDVLIRGGTPREYAGGPAERSDSS